MVATEQAAKGVSEDWLSLWIGLLIFILSLGVFVGADVLGWGVTTAVWTDVSKALAPVSKAYVGLSGIGSLLATYVFLLIVMTVGAALLRANIGKFIGGFTVVFWASYVCWIIGSWAYIAATSDKLKAFGIPWSLNLTAEAGFHRGPDRGARRRQSLPGRERGHQGSDAPRVVHQDGHRDSRGLPRRSRPPSSWGSPPPSCSAGSARSSRPI